MAREEQDEETGYTPPEKDLEAKISERDQRMEEIAEREAAKREEESGNAPAPEPVVKPDPEPAPEPATKEEPEVIVLEGDLSRYRLKSKVDGEEEIVPLDPVVRQFQKDKAADKRLAEATRILNEAKDMAARAQPKAPDPEPAPAAIMADGADDAFIESLFEGDKEKAKESLRKALAAGRQPVAAPTLDTKKLIDEIAPSIKQQLAVENALERFRADHADIVADPYLASIAERFWSEGIDAGEDQIKALQAAGQKTRDWLKAKGVVVKDPTPTVTRDEKLKRKAEIDSLPTTSTRATQPEEPELSVHEIMAEMRKARGFGA